MTNKLNDRPDNLPHQQTDVHPHVIANAYASPPWWYDIRGFFILTFAYQSTLWNQVRFFAQNISEKHMEVAIGTGTLFSMVLRSRRWRRHPIRRVIGMDYSESMLDGARKRFAAFPAVEIRREDIVHLSDADASYTSVNIANALHCFIDVDAALSEVNRVLAPGGTLALNVLLYPRGIWPLRHIAGAINRWGIRKGILVTPYHMDDVRNRLAASGFDIHSESVEGNCYFVVAAKPQEPAQ